MTEARVEAIFGTDAGIVWRALNGSGPSTIDNIVKATSLSRESVYAALGWLGRENKIIIIRRGRSLVFSLRDEETNWQISRSTIADDLLPQGKWHQAGVPPKKTAEARRPKAQTSPLHAVKKALIYILNELEANREPTPEEVSRESGMDSRQLGRSLSKLNIRSKSIRREGKSARIYPIALKARVWELAALDAEGLQMISRARDRTTENIKERNQENYTVFD